MARTRLATRMVVGREGRVLVAMILDKSFRANAPQILPWDSDVDVMVTESSIYYLAAYYNMTTFWFKTRGYKQGRNYLLEVNPNYKNREQTDIDNRIDARWIDTETGLFIDITAARYNLTHPQGEGMMSCKDGHEFRVRRIRNTTSTAHAS